MNTSIKSQYKRIMIFGRPGSGKSTFAHYLSAKTKLPLHHLDKYFFVSNWVERDYESFMLIQEALVNEDAWIIDGNSTKSLETRWSKADLVLYFNYNRLTCLYRLVKRLFYPAKHINDRAENCEEKLEMKLIQYMLTFDDRVKDTIYNLRQKYPKTTFYEIDNDSTLSKVDRTI